MKKLLQNFIVVFFSFFACLLLFASPTSAQIPDVKITPQVCAYGPCPSGVVYREGESCVGNYSAFQASPARTHFWMEDPEITTQGKTDERARQFIYWTLYSSAIDNHPTLSQIWNVNRNIAYFFVVFIAAIMGIGIIIGQRANFNLRVNIRSQIFKIGGSLLYITFSAAIVILLIQLSEIVMKFFVENLGGRDLFNIYFSSNNAFGTQGQGASGTGGSETNYLNFVGCRDLNLRVQEGVKTELFMLKATNVTYYVMGIMLILRKILLWFLLFVSPFLGILLPFTFIRNIGLIWIGVFFQWLFYGPLFALFLGALAKIWQEGIPFIFNFARAGKPEGYLYPTAINITYGGPAQILGPVNNANYIDTYAEYIITLVMLWAVIVFPWWLLRIFRDYCCDGILAMKNILLSMYDQMRGGPPAAPPPQPPAQPTRAGTAINFLRDIEVPVKIRLETIEEIRKAQTEEIVKSINISATKLTDVARFETSRATNETVRRNMNYLQNPMRAETPTQRQQFMNIRSELFNRAIKEDQKAKQILASISTSPTEQKERKENFAKGIVQGALPLQKPTNYKAIAEKTGIPASVIEEILSLYGQQPTSSSAAEQKRIVHAIAQQKKLKEEDVAKIIDIATQPGKAVEQIITIPPTVSLEDYENVKKMWKEQYQKGDIPISENIKSRGEWVSQDTVFITNVINKLISADITTRQQGLDDVGYVLPIFMINNFKGQELLVYLKAKLEAAKAVQEELEKEQQIKDELKEKKDETLVEVERPKQEEKAQEMQVQQEQSLPEGEGKKANT